MSGNRIDLVELFSYVALVVFAIIMLLDAFNIASGRILTSIAYISAFIGLVFAAYSFQRRQRHIAWTIIFWIAVVVFILALIKMLGVF